MNDTNNTKQKYVILDADIGSDDAWALFTTLQTEKYLKNIKLLGITCVAGNAPMKNILQNTNRVLERIGRNDIAIFEGAHEALIPGPPFATPFHGFDGMADLGDEYFKNFREQNNIRPENAIEAIKTFALQYPKQVTIICVGPLTNIALTLKTYHGLSEQLAGIYIMGGNYLGIGNTSRCAEYNFWVDPEAANIVLHAAKCPITILPWESCMDDKIDIPKDWRFNVIGNVNNKFIQFLNDVERKLYKDFDSWLVCDALLAAAALFPECILKMHQCHATVELGGQHTRGQVVIDHTKKMPNNVTIISKLCSKKIREIFQWIADPETFPMPN